MKLKIALLAVGSITLFSCKKDIECECTTVYYTDGIYSNTEENKYTVKNSDECLENEVNTAAEVTTCSVL